MKRLSVLLPLSAVLALAWPIGSALAAPAGYAPAATASVTRSGRELDVFWRAADNSIRESSRSAGTGAWVGAGGLPGTALAPGAPAYPSSAPAAAAAGTGTAVFWRGADNGIWETSWTDAGGWTSTPVELPGSAGTASSGPAALARRQGAELEVLWRAADGSILQEHSTRDSGGWAGPTALPETRGNAASTPTAASFDDDSLEVAWRGGDGGIWVTRYGDTGGWEAGPAEIPGTAGQATSAPSATTSRAGTELDIFWRGEDGTVVQAYSRIAAPAWSAPAAVPGTQGAAASAPAAAVSRQGQEVDVLWRGSDGTLWQTAYADGGGWSSRPSYALPTAGALPRAQLELSPTTSPDGVKSGSYGLLPSTDGHAPTGFTGTGINVTSDVLEAICRGEPSFPQPASRCGGGNESPSFATLQSGLGLTYGRVSVPWDAIQTSNDQGTGCVNDEAASVWPHTVTPAYQAFYERLVAAQAAGLTPEVVLTVAGNPTDPAFPDPTDQRGNMAYRCGVQGLLNDSANRGFAIHYWEAFNEPDGKGGFEGRGPRNGCGPSFGVGVQIDGAGKAACLWEIAADEDRQDRRHDQIAAGSFAFFTSVDPQLHYVRAYAATLLADARVGRALPQQWALHPYEDVIGGMNCQQIAGPGCTTTGVTRFAAYLATLEPVYDIWLTEASAVLDGPGTSGQPNAIDGVPAYQAGAAEAFLNLPRATAHVTQEDWYGIQAPIGEHWDSAMLDGNGTPRSSYCVLAFGMTPVTADSTPGCADPTAARDWGNPRASAG